MSLTHFGLGLFYAGTALITYDNLSRRGHRSVLYKSSLSLGWPVTHVLLLLGYAPIQHGWTIVPISEATYPVTSNKISKQNV